jgi:hypothetical protein
MLRSGSAIAGACPANWGSGYAGPEMVGKPGYCRMRLRSSVLVSLNVMYPDFLFSEQNIDLRRAVKHYYTGSTSYA